MSSMALAPGAILRRGSLLVERRPELPALAVAAGAWVVLFATAPRPAQPAVHHHQHMGGMEHGTDAWSMSGAQRGAILWVAMTVAMMLPLTIPSLRYVGRMVPRSARLAATATFSAGYVVAWLPGVVLAIAVHARPPAPGSVVVAAFVVAAAWELTLLKRKALLRCHRHHVVRAHQPARRRSCWRFGLRRGAWCMASCGPVMGALMVGAHALVPMVVVTIGLAVQQFNPVAHWYRTWSAGGLVALAACTPLIT